MAIPFYDAPDALIGMAIDRELTARGTQAVLSEVMTGNIAATPNERVGFIDRLRAEASEHGPLAEALVGVATNPFVWLTFLTEPTIIGKVASQTGRLLVSRPEFVPWIRKYGTMLQSIGMEWTGTMMHGTGASRVMEDILHVRTVQQEQVGRRLADKVVRSEAGEATYAKLRNLDRVTAKQNLDIFEQAYVEGWYRPTPTRQVFRVVEDKDGLVTGYAEEIKENLPRIKMSKEDLERELKLADRLDLVKARQEEYNRRAHLMFGKEDASGNPLYTGPLTKDNIDREKIGRVFGSLYGTQDRSTGAIKQALGQSSLGKLFDKFPDDPDHILDFLEDYITTEMNNPFYSPRNTGVVFRKATDTDIVVAHRDNFMSSLPFPSSALTRTKQVRVFENNAIRAIGRAFNDKSLEVDLMTQARKSFKAVDPGEIVRIDIIDPEVSFERYMMNTGTAYSLYGRKASEESIRSFGEAVDAARREMTGNQKLRDKTRFMSDLIEPTSRVHRDAMGGMSNADLLDDIIQMIPESNPVRSQMQDVVLPRLTGSVPKEQMFATSFINTARSLVGGLNKTLPVMAAIEDAGPVGKKMASGLRDFESFSFKVGEQDPMRSIADYLYNTHLGLNFGSVMANLTQPLITLTRLNADLPTMISAYGSAIKGMFRYADEFAKEYSRTGRMTPSAHDAVKRKAFGDSVFEMAELGGTSRAIYADEVSQEVASLVGAKSRIQQAFGVMMGPFQTAEMMNRVVAAKWGQKMMGLSDDALRASPRAQHEIARVVRETQFGASVLNTPTTFMNPASMFSNPLIRQFLQFPVRMALSPFVIDSRIEWAGGSPSSPIGKASQFLTGGPAVNNVVRGIGFSALGYELIKGLFDVNASRYGYLEGTLAIPGTVIDKDQGPLPIPPIISVGSDALQFLATGDRELAARTIPRLIPGGIALARGMNVGPDVDQILPEWARSVNFQRTYADYQNPNEDGTVNVYNWKGQLMYRVDRMELALQGLGLDPKGFQDEAEPTQIAQAAIEGERSYRRAALQAMSANNFQRVESLSAEFQKRFGYELPINQRHMDSFARNKTMTREEIVLRNVPDTIEPDLFRQIRELEAISAPAQQ